MEWKNIEFHEWSGELSKKVVVEEMKSNAFVSISGISGLDWMNAALAAWFN